LFFKLENCNPSGSYKDRFVAAQISHIMRNGVNRCVATSSGNTGSSLASYCARYGLACAIVVNENVPVGKLEQMQAYGARVLRVRKFVTSTEVTDAVYSTLTEMSRESGLSLVVSAYRYCPHGMAGVEQLSTELRRQLKEPIDHVFVPIGGGGLYCAVCKGFQRVAHRPQVHAVQPRGCATVVAALERADGIVTPVDSTTAVSGLSVPFDIDATLALRYLRDYDGRGFAIDDEEILSMHRLMIRKEGILCEPAGATAAAALGRAVDRGVVQRNQTIICLVTGHGFKDPDSMRSAAAAFASETIDVGELASHLATVQ
jgi:threonine synthase